VILEAPSNFGAGADFGPVSDTLTFTILAWAEAAQLGTLDGEMTEPQGPGQIELTASYSRHLGPKFDSAGLRIQFHYNQAPGVHFKVPARDEYRPAIERGLADGMARRFPNFPSTASIWVLEIIEDPVDSSAAAFYRVAVAIIEQAYIVATTQMRVTPG
jgi:hypothetical protein